jgi:hypothetical protein
VRDEHIGIDSADGLIPSARQADRRIVPSQICNFFSRFRSAKHGYTSAVDLDATHELALLVLTPHLYRLHADGLKFVVLEIRTTFHVIPLTAGSEPAPRAAGGTLALAIPFGSIVGNAEHLTIPRRTFADLAPCLNVISVHFVELVESALFRVVPNRAERAVRLGLALACLRLLGVCGFLYLVIEYPNGQELLVYRTAQEILEDLFAIRHVRIGDESGRPRGMQASVC